MVVVSGTKIADEIGTNRSEVWRMVQQLRGLGVVIAGHPATGYQLESMPDLLLPDYVAPLVRGTMFASRIHHYFKTDSTNVAAMEAAQTGEPEGAVFLAEEQLAGRGRGGHSWHSARSTGIYCSVILRPQLSPADVVVISLMTGLAVQSAVEEVTGTKPDLRWPNDLLLTRAPSPDDPTASGGSRKFCGILAEMNAEATRIRYLVVGMGLNVNQAEFPEDLRDLATSLRIETGRTWSRVELTAALLRAFDREYKKVHTGDPLARRDVMRRFEQNSTYARGLRVHVDEDGDGYEGVTDGLDERGFLRVRTEHGLKTVLSGGVRAI
jgi:BirA family biotin operon repressor/biotin-[acetyl-CoA-carboxylase] ligase